VAFGSGGQPKAVQPFASRNNQPDSFRASSAVESNGSQNISTVHRPFVPPLSPRLRSIPGSADNLLSIRDTAERLGLSTATVYALCDRGELPHIRISNAIRVAPADLADYLAQRRKIGTKKAERGSGRPVS